MTAPLVGVLGLALIAAGGGLDLVTGDLTPSRIRTRSRAGRQGASRRLAAEILVQVAKRRDIPYHLPLGVTAAEWSIRLDEQLLSEDRKWRAVSRSADFTEPYPAQFPPDTAG